MGCLLRLTIAFIAYCLSFEGMVTNGRSLGYARQASGLGALAIFVFLTLFFKKKKKKK